MSAASRCEVAVVGGGLVGAALALGLHRRGIDVRMIDRDGVADSADDYDLRVYAISPASRRFLQTLGVWDAIVAERSSPYTHMQVWESVPESALHFDAADVRMPDLGAIVESRVIQRQLWAALPPAATLVQAVQDLAIDTAPDGRATLTLADGSRLSAALVIAADSARSPLRERRGIEVLRAPYAQTAIVCHVQTERPHRGTAYQRFLPEGPLALLPLADGRSSIVWSTEDAAALMALDDAKFRVALGAASQQVLGAVLETTRRVSFPLALQHAERYVEPRFALAGDAAHVVHPLAGQGVNLGFGDAEALVGILAEARAAGRDIGGLRVLQRYQRARRVAVQDMIAVTDGLYRAYRLQQPAWNWLRQQGMRLAGAVAPARQLLVRRACGIDS